MHTDSQYRGREFFQVRCDSIQIIIFSTNCLVATNCFWNYPWTDGTGAANSEGIRYYNSLIDSLLEKGYAMRPFRNIILFWSTKLLKGQTILSYQGSSLLQLYIIGIFRRCLKTDMKDGWAHR